MNEDDLNRIVASENNCSSSQEDPTSYDIGGYMPIAEGDNLDDKYEVCRKLGYGQFSTVWLCQNKLNDEFVAIKVSKSQSKLRALAQDEIKLLDCAILANPDHAGYKNIVQMFDFFSCQSVNGNHTAIVLEVMGPSLLHLIKQSEYRGIQLPGVRRIIKQVLQGLQYLHEECGIIHTDLKPENILIKAKEPYIRQMVNTAKRFSELGIIPPKTYVTSNRWSDVQPYSKDLEEYERAQLLRTRSYPQDPFLSEIVSFRRKHAEPKLKGPMWIDANIEVKIGDMGNATWVNNKYNSTIQTRQYRALEVILDAGYDCPADVWSVGCLAFELATGEFLFYPKMYNNFSLDVDHITLIWEVLGGIPTYITKRGSKADTFFSNGKLKHIEESELKIWKIEDVLVDKYKWKRLDAIPFAGFIEYLIEPDPSLRYTASAALSCEWINEQ
ncbi:SRSF protein kinase 1 [Tribolium castaneum]|nr:PREDICTED: SRSF protein kinase 1 [Tribolium castaneum]XP_015836841.1 PREDICTED: SRSF protein kinase 1 [Tribolium castaneum]|eukprot:XP_015836836.1 PREDICTED: SRSF protein kinase 1 [Tribolium castaneum]